MPVWFKMGNICIYFQVHQPMRLRKYTVFDITKNDQYFDMHKNREILEKVAHKCYRPANELFLKLIEQNKGKFRLSYSISGVVLQQFEQHCPDVLESFRRLARTGCVEFLSETSHHSLSFLYSEREFREQLNNHTKLIWKHFRKKPRVFRNTELIFNNDLAKCVESLGYKAILAEGADHVLGWRSPNFVYRPEGCSSIKLLLKNYRMSDDIAFRFSERSWKEWPLTADKYVSWIDNAGGNVLNLFMDYETIGEHQWEDTGIFDFFSALPEKVLRNPENSFKTVSEVAEQQPVATLNMPFAVSWADTERDLSAWNGNSMQRSSLSELYRLEKAIKESGDPELLENWRRLQTSDHFYYMCTKYFNDGDVHKYFNPYDSPYDSFIAFMNILNDLSYRLKKGGSGWKMTETPSIEAAR
ncbi:MAG: glycoside hydrolase family 57 protein [archaeon]